METCFVRDERSGAVGTVSAFFVLYVGLGFRTRPSYRKSESRQRVFGGSRGIGSSENSCATSMALPDHFWGASFFASAQRTSPSVIRQRFESGARNCSHTIDASLVGASRYPAIELVQSDGRQTLRQGLGLN